MQPGCFPARTTRAEAPASECRFPKLCFVDRGLTVEYPNTTSERLVPRPELGNERAMMIS